VDELDPERRVDTMAILSSLQRLLDANHVPYEVHAHRTAMTAAEIAAADHVPRSEVAKVVVLRSGERFLLAVLPAGRQLDLDRFRTLAGDPELRLASEGEFAGIFPACELGAIPPIGDLWGLPVWVDDALGREAETVFSGGNHHETVHVAYRDFVRLAKPTFGEFSRRTSSH
jgi:Ala-tRNA(Pro) deacylase